MFAQAHAPIQELKEASREDSSKGDESCVEIAKCLTSHVLGSAVDEWLHEGERSAAGH